MVRLHEINGLFKVQVQCSILPRMACLMKKKVAFFLVGNYLSISEDSSYVEYNLCGLMSTRQSVCDLTLTESPPLDLYSTLKTGIFIQNGDSFLTF